VIYSLSYVWHIGLINYSTKFMIIVIN